MEKPNCEKKQSGKCQQITENPYSSAYSPVSFLQLFRFADVVDMILMTIGVLASIISGLSMPACNFATAVLTVSLTCYLKNKNIQAQSILDNNGNSSAANSSCHVPNLNHSDANNRIWEKNCEYWTADNIHLEVMYVAIIIAAIGAISMIFGYIRVLSLNTAANNQVHRISGLYLKSVLRQDIAWFDDKRTGEFAINSIDGMQKYKAGISTYLEVIIFTAVSCISSYICCIIYGWKLSLVAILLAFITVGNGLAVAKLSSFGKNKSMKAQASVGNYFEGIMSSLKTVVAHGGEEIEAERFEEQLNAYSKSCIKYLSLTSFAYAIARAMFTVSIGVIIWYGFHLMSNEFCSSEPVYGPFVMTLVINCVIFSAYDISVTLPALLAVKESQNAIAFVYSVIDRIPPIDSLHEDGLRPNTVLGEIELSSVKFNYPSRPDVTVLDDISCKVNAGETLAIVGESGSGKSTIIQLIQRFYDVIYGKVTIDGNDVRELNIGWLRKHIGVVGQEPVLFSTTIAENIRFGRKDATKKDIEDAAKDAFAHDFICDLPKKYETVIGDRGSQLSGGQKQRIAIARALVANPKILLLDEATSALDYRSEIQVLKALKQASIGRTTIVVTHRLSVIQDVDKICVIFNGKIAEFGNHSELMGLGGFYFDLMNRQDKTNETPEIIDTAVDKGKNETTLSYREVSDIVVDAKVRKSSGKKEGIIATFQKNPLVSNSTTERDSDMAAAIRLLNDNSPELKYIILVVLMSILTGSGKPFALLSQGVAYTNFLVTDIDEFTYNTVRIIVYFTLLAVYNGIALFLQHLLFGIFEQKLTRRLRLRLLKSILCQEMAWFDRQGENAGDVYTNLLYDVSNIIDAIRTTTVHLVDYISILVVVMVACCLLDWKLGLVVVAFTPLIIAVYKIDNNVVYHYSKKEATNYKKTSKIAIEAIANIRTVASLHGEISILDNYEMEKKLLERAATRTAHVQGMMCGLSHGMTGFIISAVTYYGTILTIQNELSFASFMVITRMVYMLSRQFGFFISMSSNIDKGYLSVKRLYKIFDRKSAIDRRDKSGKQPSAETFKPLELSRVHFSYPSRQEVTILQGIDLNAFRGQTVGLVGSSGCGKSTILQLFLRMYDPQSGTVKYADEDVKKLNVAALRANIGIVSQEPVLFDRSIKDNIAYGDNTRTIPFDEIISAAKTANIHNFISSLPDGYNTRVGDHGILISGGQKQRIAIARALVRNPKVLFLDEATSALDSENEKVVQEALEEAQLGRTSIVIAHRLSTIVNCDAIVAMHDGKIVEVGSHYELLKKQGYYSKMYETHESTVTLKK